MSYPDEFQGDRMTPTEALAQALDAVDMRPFWSETHTWPDGSKTVEFDEAGYAAAILDALPEGCGMWTPDLLAAMSEEWQKVGAQRERERLLGDMDLTPAQTAQGYLRKHGFVFDKWPPDANRPADRLGEFDEVTRWQGAAFSLYTDLVAIENHLEQVLTDPDEADHE